jgi:hypothetical protein
MGPAFNAKKTTFVLAFTNNSLYSNRLDFHQEKVSLKNKNWLEIKGVLF